MYIKIFQENGNRKQAGVTILISHKIDFKLKVTRGDRERHFISIKETIKQEDKSILTCMHQTLGFHKKKKSTTLKSRVKERLMSIL